MSSKDTVELGTLGERAERIRSLARALVRDEHEAEDLAQDAWLTALTKRPAQDESWTAWITAVMRNFARARWRSNRRRTTREQEVARSECHPSHSDPLDQLDAHELLVRAVRELHEPYRSTILLRYFEGLTPGQITERTGVPLRTVNTRLVRGLALLRERLDQSHRGNRDAWLGLLLPLVRTRNVAVAGALAVSTKLKVVIVAIVLLGLFWVAHDRWVSEAPIEHAGPNPAASELATQQGTLDVGTSERAAVNSATTSPQQITRSEPTAANMPRIYGSVVDTSGRGLASMNVVLTNPDPRELMAGFEARTDANGDFELALPGRAAELDIEGNVWVVVLRPRISPQASAQHVIVVAPRRALAGIVVDENGAPIEGVDVALSMPRDLRASIHRVLDLCSDELSGARSDPGGAFAFAAVPDIDGCDLGATFQGFDDASASLDRGDRLDLRLVLKRHADPSGHRIGRVIDARGAPVEGAFVTLADHRGYQYAPNDAVTTNARGEFDLPIDLIMRSAAKLQAVKPGYLPAELESRSGDPHDLSAWPRPIELVLAGSPLSIEGIVLDADGKPIEDAVITNLDTTRFGNVTRSSGDLPGTMSEDIETLLAGESFSTAVATDAHGRFEVRGLLAKSYRLRVFARQSTMEVTVTEPIQAGARNVEIRMPREERIARIAGRVVGASGAPASDAHVSLWRSGPAPNESSVRWHDSRLGGRSVKTDVDGRFEFRDVPRDVDELHARLLEQFGETSVQLADIADLEDIEIVVTRNCHVKIDLTGSPLKPTSIAVLDAKGEMLFISVSHGSVGFSGKRFGIDRLGSEALSVSEAAAELVLYGEQGAELARIPLHLAPGELTIVRP